MKSFILLFCFLSSSILHSQKFHQQNISELELIYYDFRKNYTDNPLTGDSYLYGGTHSNISVGDYLYLFTRKGIVKVKKDGSAVDSLFAYEYRSKINFGYWDIYGDTIGNTYSDYSETGFTYIYSTDLGLNWNEISGLGDTNASLYVSGHYKLNTFYCSLNNKSNIFSDTNHVVIAKNNFADLDTVNIIKASGSSEIFSKKSYRGSGSAMDYFNNDYYRVFNYDIRDEIVKDSIVDRIYLIIKTENEGKSWERYDLPENIGVSNFEFFGDTVIAWGGKPQYFLGKGQPGTPPYFVQIIKSTDRGHTWEVILDADTLRRMNDLAAYDSKIMAFATGNGGMFYTRDGGENWFQAMHDSLNYHISHGRLTYDDESSDILYYHSFNAKIFKMRLEYPTVSVAEEINIPLKLFPNPAKDELTLEFTAEKAVSAKIYITDVLGNNIAVLYDDFITAGSNSFTFSVPKGISSGSYYVTLEMNGVKHAEVLKIAK